MKPASTLFFYILMHTATAVHLFFIDIYMVWTEYTNIYIYIGIVRSLRPTVFSNFWDDTYTGVHYAFLEIRSGLLLAYLISYWSPEPSKIAKFVVVYCYYFLHFKLFFEYTKNFVYGGDPLCSFIIKDASLCHNNDSADFGIPIFVSKNDLWIWQVA